MTAAPAPGTRIRVAERVRNADKSRARVEWATEAADVRTEFIAIVSVTPASAHHQQQREGDDSHDNKKPVLHGS